MSELSKNETVLIVKNLKKSFRSDFYKKSVQILRNIHFEIPQGHFVGLVGPNGSGKTTTIKCLLDFCFPDQGQIQFFNNVSILEAKKRIGFLPERPYFQEFLTGTEFLSLQWSLSRSGSYSRFLIRADEVLKQVKLEHAKNKKLKDYSKGMLQRIGIAQALISEPDFLILDEPMSGLDPDGRILIKDILLQLKKQKISVLMSSHLLQDLDELCDDLIVIHQGETYYSGALEKFKKEFNTLEEAYRSFKKGFVTDLNV